MSAHCSNQEPARWFATAAGRQLLRAEQSTCSSIVSNVYGHLGVAFRCAEVPADLVSSSQVLTAFVLDCSGASESIRPVRASTRELPVCSGCLQLVVVHHIHEVVADPLVFLREVARILAPSGVAILTGLNPVGKRLRWRPLPAWIRHWRRPESLAVDAAPLGLQALFIRPVFCPERVVQRAAERMHRGPLRGVARLLASGYVLAIRKMDHPARIVDRRVLRKNTARGINDAAPSAGMSPLNANR